MDKQFLYLMTFERVSKYRSLLDLFRTSALVEDLLENITPNSPLYQVDENGSIYSLGNLGGQRDIGLRFSLQISIEDESAVETILGHLGFYTYRNLTTEGEYEDIVLPGTLGAIVHQDYEREFCKLSTGMKYEPKRLFKNLILT